MNTLEQLLRKKASEVFTENGDITYDSTLNANLDFFAAAGSLRRDQKKVSDLMLKAALEDGDMAVKNLFYLRDIRGGLGERDSFRTSYRTLFERDPKVALRLLPAVPEYGRWDDILFLLEEEKGRKAVTEFIASQLTKDIEAVKEGKPVSLCAKWMPSVNTSSKKTREYARILLKELGIDEKSYRKLLSTLRGYIDILERRMSVKDYSFDYAKLPSKALMKHTKAFLRNDEERYMAFKKSLEKGEVKAKTNAVYPYEILRLEDEELREVMWRDLNRNMGDAKTIVVRDGSGSMTWGGFYGSSVCPLDVATSLAILFSEQLTGAFKDKFITFSSRPEFVDLSGCKSLKDKIRLCNTYNDCSNTDITATYRLILEAEKNCDPKDWIEKMIIISDMQFDEGTRNVPTYEEAKVLFEEAGIPFPQIVYWNVASRCDFPSSDLENVRLVSGLSQYIIEGILKDETPDGLTYMKKVLERYDPVLELLK
ncbi:MAG: DUF2828 family protein [Erysipelotrichaceae bacterium]|nr:DUF2828 family protein [Erysipelotrichaceae bacterium]